jgi:hypothetical protein
MKSDLTVTLSPTFKLVFLSVLAITICSMLVACPLAIFQIRGLNMEPGTPLSIVFETCITTFKLGFGAMIGLLGGKAL